MKNLADFKVNKTLDNIMFYVCSLDFDSIDEYIEEVYEGSIDQFKIAIKDGLVHYDQTYESINESFQAAVDWFEYKKLLEWRGIEDQHIIEEQSSMLIVKNEKCKIWVVVDSEDGGVVILKDTHVDYDDRDDYSNEYSDKFLKEDLIKKYTYEELYEGVEIEAGYNVWIGNDETDGVFGLRLVFRKI